MTYGGGPRDTSTASCVHGAVQQLAPAAQSKTKAELLRSDIKDSAAKKESFGPQHTIPARGTTAVRHKAVDISLLYGAVYLVFIVFIFFIWVQYTKVMSGAASELAREARGFRLLSVRELFVNYFHDYESQMEYLRGLVTASDVAGDPFAPHWIDHMRAMTWAAMSAFPTGAGRLGVTWESGAVSYGRFVTGSHLELRLSFVTESPRLAVVDSWLAPATSTWHLCAPERCACQNEDRADAGDAEADASAGEGGSASMPKANNRTRHGDVTEGAVGRGADAGLHPVVAPPPVVWRPTCVRLPGCAMTTAVVDAWSIEADDGSGKGLGRVMEALGGTNWDEGQIVAREPSIGDPVPIEGVDLSPAPGVGAPVPWDAPPPVNPPAPSPPPPLLPPLQHTRTSSSAATCLLPPPNVTVVKDAVFFDAPWVRTLVRGGGNLLAIMATEDGDADMYGVNADLLTSATVPAARFGRAGPLETVLGVSFSTTELSKQLADFTRCHGSRAPPQSGHEILSTACGSRVFVLDLDGRLVAASHGRVRDRDACLLGVASDDPLIRLASASLVDRYGPPPLSVDMLLSEGGSISMDDVSANDTVQLIDAVLTGVEGTAFLLVVVTPQSTAVKRMDETDRLYFTLLLVLLLFVFVLAVLLMSRLKRKLTLERTLRGELLESKMEAEAACQAKGMFLANMSHEMRTPLTAVQGFLDLLISEYSSSQLSASALEYATFARTSASMLLHVVNDVLDLEKMRNGNLDLESVLVDLQELLESVVNLFAMKLFPQVEIVLAMTDRCPRFVVGDAFRIKQIFMNLLSNSVRFTRSGRILVSLDAVALPPRKPPASHGAVHRGPHEVPNCGVGDIAGCLQEGSPGRPSPVHCPPSWASSCAAGVMSAIPWLRRNARGATMVPASRGPTYYSVASSAGNGMEPAPDGATDAHPSVPAILPAATPEEVQLLVAVDDTGAGLPQDKWESVFEDFVQADASTTRMHGGTGLGLSIVRRIVHKMGGSVHFVHKDGPGARVELSLAVGVAAEQEREWLAFICRGLLAGRPPRLAPGESVPARRHEDKGGGGPGRGPVMIDFFRSVVSDIGVAAPSMPLLQGGGSPVNPPRSPALRGKAGPSAASDGAMQRWLLAVAHVLLPLRTLKAHQVPQAGSSEGSTQRLLHNGDSLEPMQLASVSSMSSLASMSDAAYSVEMGKVAGHGGGGGNGQLGQDANPAHITLDLFPHLSSADGSDALRASLCGSDHGMRGQRGEPWEGGCPAGMVDERSPYGSCSGWRSFDDAGGGLPAAVFPGLTIRTSIDGKGGRKGLHLAVDAGGGGRCRLSDHAQTDMSAAHRRGGRGPDTVLLALAGPAERASVARWLVDKGLAVAEAASVDELDALLWPRGEGGLHLRGEGGDRAAGHAAAVRDGTSLPGAHGGTRCGAVDGGKGGTDGLVAPFSNSHSPGAPAQELPWDVVGPLGGAVHGGTPGGSPPWGAKEDARGSAPASSRRDGPDCEDSKPQHEACKERQGEDSRQPPQECGGMLSGRGHQREGAACGGSVDRNRQYFLAIIDVAFLAPSTPVARSIPVSPPGGHLSGYNSELDAAGELSPSPRGVAGSPRSTSPRGPPAAAQWADDVVAPGGGVGGGASGGSNYGGGEAAGSGSSVLEPRQLVFDSRRSSNNGGYLRSLGPSDEGAPPGHVGLHMEDVVGRLPMGCPLVWVTGASSKKLKDCIPRSRAGRDRSPAWQSSRMACARHPLHPWRLLALLAAATSTSPWSTPRGPSGGDGPGPGPASGLREVDSGGKGAAAQTPGTGRGGALGDSGWRVGTSTDARPPPPVEFKSAARLFSNLTPVHAGLFPHVRSATSPTSRGSPAGGSATPVGAAVPIDAPAQVEVLVGDIRGGASLEEARSSLGGERVHVALAVGGDASSAGQVESSSATEAPGASSGGASAAGSPLEDAKVLVAEDNKINQVLLKHVLAKLGVTEFSIVANGSLAVEALTSNAWSCILMDCNSECLAWAAEVHP
eukprot:jgi/Mesvir1/13817/Mv15970-RA.2